MLSEMIEKKQSCVCLRGSGELYQRRENYPHLFSLKVVAGDLRNFTQTQIYITFKLALMVADVVEVVVTLAVMAMQMVKC